MKLLTFKTKLYLTAVLIFLSFMVLAQKQENVLNVAQSKNELRISGEFSHLFHNLNLTPVDDYNYINPKGIELAYYHCLKNDWKIGTSLFYNWSNFYTQIDEKYDCNESGISLLFKKVILITDDQKGNWAFSFGSYNGIASNISFYYHDEFWSKVQIWDSMPDSFNEKFFSDLYADIEWSRSLNNFGKISFSPFTKYRIIKNDTNTKYTGFQLGVKIGYSLSF